MSVKWKAHLVGLTLLFSFNTLANDGLILDTLFQQGVKFISSENYTGQSASAFATLRMMTATDGQHPKTKAYANLLERTIKNQVAQLQKAAPLQAEKLKLDYLSLQYELGQEPSAWLLAENTSVAAATTVVQAPAQAVKPKAKPETLSSKQKKILLSNAKIYIQRKQFFTPSDKNAMKNIRRVLASEPTNERAIRLYFSTIEKTRDLVENLIDDEAYAQALGLANSAVEALPDNYELERLQDLAAGRNNMQKHAMELFNPERYVAKLKSGVRNRVLSNGRKLAQQKAFFAPKSENAYAKYRRVLISEQNHEKTIGYMQRLAKDVSEHAFELKEDGNTDAAISLLEQGLEKVPEMTEWATIKHEMIVLNNLEADRVQFAQQNYSTTLSRKSIRILTTNTKVYLTNGQFFGSGKDNANTAILRVLATEPDNKKMLTYQRQLLEKVASKANDLIEDGQFSQAISLVEEALKNFPAHPDMMTIAGHLNSLTQF